MGSMTPKEIKIYLHYAEVQRRFTTATRHQLQWSKVKIEKIATVIRIYTNTTTLQNLSNSS